MGELARTVLAPAGRFLPVRKIEPAPISMMYVWLDRPLHMMRLAENLRDTTIEWVFDTTGMHDGDRRPLARGRPGVVHLRDDEFIRRAIEPLHQHYSEARAAEVLRAKVFHPPQARFSAHPGFESLRLSRQTPIGGPFLAGDWTRIELPFAMESAAESARRAVGAVQGYVSLQR
ncbi:FAD-dependent oxidoreductase [Nocardia beijingensis]|uniref:FAD-dependent oxidoreductase n=1 Tax=Nocardia beijingensis TaxID=95162 RepID=UPI0033DA0A77